jgi:mannose-1-phosphate guanylyltransferase
MHEHDATWGIILAGGEGRRLQSLTRDEQGRVVPKQFCSFLGDRSLLRSAIDRLAAVVERRRIIVVVAASHRRWWQRELVDIEPENILVQPVNRGTACGVLLPLAHIAARDPEARVVVAPSDHFVEDEPGYASSLQQAAELVASRPGLLIVLGIRPDHPSPDYGWILGDKPGEDGVQLVSSFVEKPEVDLARRLMASGGLWNSFNFTASVAGLMARIRRALPWLAECFELLARGRHQEGGCGALLPRFYARLPHVDFAGRVLERSVGRFHVLPVPPCGWADLGTPERVTECARRWSCLHAEDCDAGDGRLVRHAAPVDLARVVAGLNRLDALTS